MQKSTLWYAITGGPCSGKSATLDHLSYLGHPTRPESARVLIEEELSRGLTLRQIRSDEAAFQRKVLDWKLAAEARENPQTVLYWERGMPDSAVYLRRCGQDAMDVLCAGQFRYRKIFLLERLPLYVTDHARNESADEARRIHEDLHQIYVSLGYDVMRVPVAPISERVALILASSH